MGVAASLITSIDSFFKLHGNCLKVGQQFDILYWFLCLGGGILNIDVKGILRVDGHIKANSLDVGVASSLSGASGGSGGSILIQTGALTGL